MIHRTYLGDSVYVALDTDRDCLVLTTENFPGHASNTIFIEHEVYENLVKYVSALRVNPFNRNAIRNIGREGSGE